jgi:hypothetical protein
MFHDEVREGAKRQTIRKHRKIPIKVGDTLYLYWHLRKKDCHLLRVEKCVEILTQPWGGLKVSEATARNDGFKSAEEMCEWINKTYDAPNDKELFDVVRW